MLLVAANGLIQSAYTGVRLCQGIASALIRPEHIALNSKKIMSALAGTIDKSTYIGSKVEYNISTAIGSVFAVAQSDKQEFEVGQPVFLKFPADKLNILSA